MKTILLKIRKIILKRNYIAKLFTLVLSIIFWAYVSSTKTGEVRFKIPLEPKNLPTNLIAPELSGKHVLVAFDGKREYLKNLNVKNVRAYVDFKRIKIDKPVKYPIQIMKNEIPEEINFSYDKRGIILTVEKLIKKDVRIFPVIKGKPAEGYIAGRYSIIPGILEVSGPGSIIRNIDFLKTEPVSIEGEKDKVIKYVDVRNGILKKLDFRDTTFRVVVPVEKIDLLEKYEVPVVLRNADPLYEYEIVDSDIIVYLKLSGDVSMDEDDIELFIDMTNKNVKYLLKNADIVEKKFPISILFKKHRESIDMVSIDPERITVRITRK